MSKRQLITRIQQLNQSAPVAFLTQFDEQALKQYLEHLRSAQERKLRIGTWLRKDQKLRMVS